jgi:DNA-binding NtrC family response regulator
LFGYEKGSHDKADVKRIGYIEQANHGILFLDEIGKAPLQVQQKLLLALDTKEFFRLGGEKPVKVDVKIIFATNDNLKALMKQGDFLPEFYYRISKFPITIPPLRKRIDDVEKFALIFRNRFEEKYKFKVDFTRAEIAVLKNHFWPGNMRELESVVEDLIVRNSVFKGKITEQKIRESFERFAIATQGLESVQKALLDLFKDWLGKKEQITKMVEAELRSIKGKDVTLNETSFGRSVVEPILANIYEKNHNSLGLIQTAASEYIGLSWGGTEKKSTLPQRLKLYPIVEKIFK